MAQRPRNASQTYEAVCDLSVRLEAAERKLAVLARVATPPVSHAARSAFLASLRSGARVNAAAKSAGVARQRFDDLHKADPEFAAEWERAVSEHRGQAAA